MKYLTLVLLLIFSATKLFSQQVSEETITGAWKVVDSKINLQMVPGLKENMDDTRKQTMEQMRISFIGTVFTFKSNKEFSISFSDKFPEFSKELEFLNHRHWKIEAGDVIAIGSKEDNYSLMKISTGSKDGKNYFILKDSPFVLEVAKE